MVEEVVNARARATASPIDRLTKREREILGEMAQGKSNAAIAASLVLSERAVEKHINSILSKLDLTEEPDVNRRVKAVLVYLAARGRVALPLAPSCHPRPPVGVVRHWWVKEDRADPSDDRR